jgi:hypothetical protein
MNSKIETKTASTIDLPVDVLEYLSTSTSVFKSISTFEKTKKDFSLTPLEQKAVEITVCETLDAQYWIDFQMKSALNIGITLAEILQIRIGLSKEERIEVLLDVTKSIVINYRNISEQLYNKFIESGFSETEFLEVISLINQQKKLIELTHYWLMTNKPSKQNEFLNLNK